MKQSIVPLCGESIRLGLAEYAGVRIQVADEIDSTNTEAKRLAAAGSRLGADDRVLIAARSQTAGRGRLGRDFFSPPDTGLYMTLLYGTEQPLDQVVTVTAAAAIAASRAIAHCTGTEVGIKWVNDLYRNGCKICGILTEAVPLLSHPGMNGIVVGWGINLTTEGFPPGLRAPAGCLLDERAPSDAPLDAGILCGRIARELLILLDTKSVTAPETLNEYRRRLILTGHRIYATRGNERMEGIVRGVDDAFGLILDTADGVRVLHSGEVSVRLCQP